MALLDAPRLAGLIGALVVVAIAATGGDVGGRTVVSANTIPSPATKGFAETKHSPADLPVLDTRGRDPDLAATSAVAAPETSDLDVVASPAPDTSSESDASQPTPQTPQEPASAPSLWTRFERPRPLVIQGRHLSFVELRADGGRVVGRRADARFAPKSPTVVVHFASWCLPCADEVPEVLALARSWERAAEDSVSEARSDVSKIETTPQATRRTSEGARKAGTSRPALVFVSHDEVNGPEALLASFEDLLARAGLAQSELPPGLTLIADPRGLFPGAVERLVTEPRSLPSLWLLDTRGRLVAHLSGPLRESDRLDLVRSLEVLR